MSAPADETDNTANRLAGALKRVPVHKLAAGVTTTAEDSVAVEEPLEIVLAWPDAEESGEEVSRNIAVTMRTPGADVQLALGFLFTEGIVRLFGDVLSAESVVEENRVVVHLSKAPDLAQTQLDRNFYMTSSCGVCGKASVDAIRTSAHFAAPGTGPQIAAATLLELPGLLQQNQQVFQGTGSIHAAALFAADGLHFDVYEDVGRHNAVDKLLGASLAEGLLPLHQFGLLVSGRASFELVQKARMAGCALLASVGAPSSLAIDLAWDSDMTLIGFLRDGRFNIYTGPARIIAG